MKLSTKSWHYKLYSVTSEYAPNDACDLFLEHYNELTLIKESL